MSINYNNINELIDLLYNYVYKEETKIRDNYQFNNLDINKINISDILKDKDFNYQLILNSSFNKENFKLLDIFGDKKKIILKKYFKNFPITLIIQKYDNIDNCLKLYEDINNELVFNQIISEFLINNDIPFYLLNICNFTINNQLLKSYVDFYDLINEKFNLYLDNEESLFCISVYEHYHSYITLKELLKNELSYEDLYNLFFKYCIAMLI